MGSSDLWTGVTTLAPNCVAIVAMIVTASQNRWQRRFSDRQQALASQQVNIGLLDRRVKVLDGVRAVISRYYFEDSDVGREDSLFKVVHEAHAIFSPDAAERLEQAWIAQVAINDLKRGRHRSNTPEERQRFIAEYEAFRKPYVAKLQQLHRDLIEQTRINK